MMLPAVARRGALLLALLPKSLVAQSVEELSPDPRASLRDTVLEAAYCITQSGEDCAWQATNPAQGMSSTFTAEDGVRVTGGDDPWSLSLELESWGRSGALAPVAAAEPVPSGRRVEYRRGPLTEWYVNDECGLVQGFTVQVPPVGAEGQPLCLALSIGVGFRAEILPGGRDAVLIDSEGGLLRYTGLRAWDSAQRELEATLAVDAGRLLVQIEDEGAVYPVHVDPVISATEAFLVPSNLLPDDRFAKSVALSGDTAVAGSPRDTRSGGADAGSAYVFERNGTTWTEEQQLIPSDAQLDDRFGYSAAIWGDTAVFGAYLEDHGGSSEVGAAYVFVRSGSAWIEQQKLTASDGMDDDRFGFSVAIWQDTIVVGAFRDDGPNTDQGSAYVFVRSGTTWTEEQKLVAGDGGVDDRFGVAVDVEGDTALIGAYRDNSGGFTDTGSAYVFLRSGTSWSQQQKLVAGNPGTNRNFGRSVALSGETALIGAPIDGNTTAALSLAGSAYVFVRSGASWSQQQELESSDGIGGDAFGQALDLFGDTAVVGAPRDDHAVGNDMGSAYVFVRSGTAWNQQEKLFGGHASEFDYFGLSVAVLGDTALIGVPRDDQGGLDAGSAYVFHLDPVVVSAYCTAGISASGCQATLSASGLPSVSAPSGFTLAAMNVEGAKDGAFYFGTTGKQAHPWGNGTSFQCVAPPVTRTGFLNGTGTVGLCNGVFTRDLNALWCPSCPFSAKAPSSGSLVQAQLWYRDPASTSSQKTSLSNALEFWVAP